MSLYESGNAAWDIGAILTRHGPSVRAGSPCARVESLRATIGQPAEQRLAEALKTACTCGSGESDSERTSLKKKARA